MKGVIIKEIDGKERGFKFGTRMFELCEDFGLNIAELQKSIKERSISTVTTIGYCAALSYCESSKIQKDFNRNDVSDWIDELGFMEFFKMIIEGVQTYEAKNVEALESQGQAGQ